LNFNILIHITTDL